MANHENYKIKKRFEFQGRTYDVGGESRLYKTITQRQFNQLVEMGKLVPINGDAGDEDGDGEAPKLKPATAAKLEKVGLTLEEAYEAGEEELKKLKFTALQIEEIREVGAPSDDDETGDEDGDGEPDDE